MTQTLMQSEIRGEGQNSWQLCLTGRKYLGGCRKESESQETQNLSGEPESIDVTKVNTPHLISNPHHHHFFHPT